MAWITDDLLTAIQNSQMFPNASANSLSNDAFMQFATEELYITLLPMIQCIREKYYETYIDTAYSTSTPSLTIPQRAIGQTLSSVQYIMQFNIRSLNPIDPGTISTTQGCNEPTSFYFQNNSIVFYPPPLATQGTLRMRYFQRPNRLTMSSNCAQITAFNSGTGVVSCNALSSWTSSTKFDFIPQYASQATPYNLNSSSTLILPGTSMTFSFTSDQAALVNVGDWISVSEYTCVPEIPFELQSVLIQATCIRGLAALNDQTALPGAMTTLEKYIENATKLLKPRDIGGNKIVASNWRRL